MFEFNNLHFVGSLCGTQKTRGACKMIAEYYGENFIYVVPSKVLANEVCTTLEEFGVVPVQITSENHPNHVMRQLLSVMSKTESGMGRVIVCTARSYLDLPFYPPHGQFTVIIDEIPQVDDFMPIDLNHDFDWISSNVRILRQGTKLGLVGPTPGIRGRIRNRDRDDVDILPLLKAIDAANRNVYVDLHSWDEALKGARGPQGECVVNFLSMLNERPFRNAIMMGANFESSIAAHWLGGIRKLKMEPYEPIRKHLTTPDQNLGKRLKLQYVLPDVNTSKSRLEADRDNGPLIDEIERVAIDRFGQEKTLFVCNNSRTETLLDEHDNFIRIPVHSRGLNTFRDVDNILITASLNRTPKHAEMLDWLGIDREVQRAATAHETFYQAVMRTSARDPGCTRPVTCLLVDKASCEYIAEVVPGTSLELVPSSYKPKRKLSNRDHIRRTKQRKWVAEVANGEGKEILLSNKENPFSILQAGDLKDTLSHPVFGTLHKSKFDSHPDQFGTFGLSFGAFVKKMRGYSETVWDRKEENAMMTPGVFLRPDGEQGYRQQRFFVASSFLMLDFDGGRTTPSDIISEFGEGQPIADKRHPFIMFNSFSASPQDPNRFRVVMFFKRPARLIAEHDAAFTYVKERLALAGLVSGESGLDSNSRSGNQTFFLPCTNSAHRDHAFFEAYGADERTVRKTGLDPQTLLAFKPKVPETASWQFNGDGEEEIRDIVESLANIQSGRRLAYFTVGRKLQSMGLSDDEIHFRCSQVLTTREQKQKLEKTMIGLKTPRPRFRYG